MSEIKVTQKEIDRLMDGAEVHCMTEFGKCTVVTVKLANGFILTESSACVDPENYNQALGKKLCLDRIESRLWELEGYALQRKVHELKEEAEAQTPPSLGSGSFGWAIECLKRGHRLRRRGWNGKSQYIELAENIRYDGNGFCNMYAAHEDIGSKAIAFCGTRGIQMGWLASQSDMLAEDWELVGCDPVDKRCLQHNEKSVKVQALTLPEGARTIRDPENEDTIWVELPDNLRLKFVDGRYAGWYTPKLEEALG